MFKTALFLICVFSQLVTADTNIEDSFQTGTRLYQEQKYEEAAEKFRLSYGAKGETPALLFNWGLATYKLNQKGMALALWRRALYLDPEMSAAKRAIDFLSDEMPADVIQPNAKGLEKLNQSLLSKFSVHKILSLTLILFTFAGFLLLRYFSARNKAILQESPLPSTPTTAITFSAIFVICLILTAAKLFVLTDVRATIISSTAVLRTGPSADDNSLFELLEGFEVIVRNIKDSSVQVTLPEGASGWVSKSDLFQHTGQERLW